MRGDLNDTGIERVFLWRHAVIPAFWMALILLFHAIPGTDLPQQAFFQVFHFDKLMHLVMFALLSSSVFIALGKSGVIRKYKWFAALGLIFYGIGLEFAQDLWFIERYASVADMIADGLGVLLGRLAFRAIYGCWN